MLDVKLKYLDSDNSKRKEVARRYIEGITNPAIILPYVKDWDANVFHIFPIRTRKRDELRAYLERNGVQTIIHYPIPPHKQECYKEWNGLSYPITEHIASEELSLPMSPVMTDEEVNEVIRIINEWLD